MIMHQLPIDCKITLSNGHAILMAKGIYLCFFGKSLSFSFRNLFIIFIYHTLVREATIEVMLESTCSLIYYITQIYGTCFSDKI